MAINVERVGHVVLKVRELERSVTFYRDVIGLKEVARLEGVARLGRMVFFSQGQNHHDLALMEVGAAAPMPERGSIGLYHVAFKIGDGLDDLHAAKTHLEANGVQILALRDHRVSQSIYLNDPDGNGLELYVDADPAIWRDDPRSVASTEPLKL